MLLVADLIHHRFCDEVTCTASLVLFRVIVGIFKCITRWLFLKILCNHFNLNIMNSLKAYRVLWRHMCFSSPNNYFLYVIMYFIATFSLLLKNDM